MTLDTVALPWNGKRAGARGLSLLHDVRKHVFSSYVLTKETLLEEYEFRIQEQKFKLPEFKE